MNIVDGNMHKVCFMCRKKFVQVHSLCTCWILTPMSSFDCQVFIFRLSIVILGCTANAFLIFIFVEHAESAYETEYFD